MGKKNHNEERSISGRELRFRDAENAPVPAGSDSVMRLSSAVEASLVAGLAPCVLCPGRSLTANGSEMLRWACCFATERGIEVHAPVQDALLIGKPVDQIDDVVAVTCDAMAQASELVQMGVAQ